MINDCLAPFAVLVKVQHVYKEGKGGQKDREGERHSGRKERVKVLPET